MCDGEVHEKELRKLFDSYHLSIVIIDTLQRNKILESKIKINHLSDDKKSAEKYDTIGCIMAEAIRKVNLNNIDGGTRSVICDLYFNDLRYRGPEWAGAKFEKEFKEQQAHAQSQIESDSEDY